MSENEMRVLRWYALGIGGLLALPLLLTIIASLNNGNTIFIPPAEWGLRWYWETVRNEALRSAFRFSLVVGTISSTLAVTLGVVASFAIERYRFPGRMLIYAVVMTPLLFPTVVLALGILSLFSQLAIPISPYGLIAGHTAVFIPFVMRLTLAGMGAIDPRLEDAGYTLGASRRRVYWSVLLPQIRPALLSGWVLAFLLSFEETTIALFTATPFHTTLPVRLLRLYTTRSDPMIAAASTMLLALTVLVAFVLDRKYNLLKLLSGTSTPD